MSSMPLKLHLQKMKGSKLPLKSPTKGWIRYAELDGDGDIRIVSRQRRKGEEWPNDAFLADLEEFLNTGEIAP